MKEIILIAAVADNGVIGKNGKLPWEKVAGDLERFRDLTIGHAVVMGRKTYESIGKPLKERRNIVVTRDLNYSPADDGDLLVCNSLESALTRASEFKHEKPFYVIGGSDIYKQTIDRANRLEITHVHQRPEGDTFFPAFDLGDWKMIANIPRNGYEFSTYERRK